VAAVDYVLKPFADDRLRAALARAKTRRDSAVHDSTAAPQRLAQYLAVDPGSATPPRLMRDGRKTLRVDPESIDWVEAHGVYVRLNAQGRPMLVRDGLSDVADRLEQHGFVRIHRSILVNIARIQQIRHRSHGELLRATPRWHRVDPRSDQEG
jgi:two-component system LytT family response regulator